MADVPRRAKSYIDEAARYRRQGMPAPPVQATRWLGEGSPAVGRPSLVVFIPPECSPGCDNSYAMLNRLRAAFPELSVTVVAKTVGYNLTGLLEPEDEVTHILAESQRAFPFAHRLAIWESTYQTLQLDGGRVPETNPNEEAFGIVVRLYSMPAAYLLDPQGRIRWWRELSQDAELQWHGIMNEIQQERKYV